MRFLRLLVKYVENIPASYVKATFGYSLESPFLGSFSYTLGRAIPYVGEGTDFSMSQIIRVGQSRGGQIRGRNVGDEDILAHLFRSE